MTVFRIVADSDEFLASCGEYSNMFAINVECPLVHLDCVHVNLSTSAELIVHFVEEFTGNNGDRSSTSTIGACASDEFGNTIMP
jgi:hypothetical protein